MQNLSIQNQASRPVSALNFSFTLTSAAHFMSSLSCQLWVRKKSGRSHGWERRRECSLSSSMTGEPANISNVMSVRRTARQRFLPSVTTSPAFTPFENCDKRGHGVGSRSQTRTEHASLPYHAYI